jgi:hypothetical protein
MIDAGLRKGKKDAQFRKLAMYNAEGCGAFLPGHAFQIRGSEPSLSEFRRDYRILGDSCTPRGNNQDSIYSLDDLADRKTMNN